MTTEKEKIKYKQQVLEVIVDHGSDLEFMTDDYKNDKDIVLAAITKDGRNLEYASPQMQDDRDIAFKAVQQNSFAIQYVSERLRNDKELILIAVKDDGDLLEYASEELRNNLEVVSTAIEKEEYSFKYAGNKLKDNTKFVYAITCESHFGTPFQFASEKCRDDKNLIKSILNFKILNNVENFTFNITKFADNIISYATEKIKNNKEFILTMIDQYGISIKNISESLKNDYEVVKAGVTNNCYDLQYAANKFKNNKEIAMIALEQDSKCFRYIEEELKNEIGTNDPINYLQAYLLHEKLNMNIEQKEVITKTKLKI